MESRDPDVCYRANLFAFAVEGYIRICRAITRCGGACLIINDLSTDSLERLFAFLATL